MIGVIKAFEEEGVKFDYIAGTSIGSILGALYASGMSSSKIEELASSVRVKDVKKSKIPLVPSPTDAIEEIIVSAVGNLNIEDLPTPFCAVAVDMLTGEEVNITTGNLAKALAGSCAVPTVFHAVKFEDKLLFDGGLQNTIPADVLRRLGCDAVISVDINSKRGNGAKSTKYFDLIKASVDIMMKSNAIKGYLNSDIIIKPDLKRFSARKTDGMLEMIEEGYLATKEIMPQIKEIFRRKKVKKHWWGFGIF